MFFFKEFSSDHVRSFRHDILYNGICMNRCKEELENYDQSYFYEAELDTDHQVKFNFFIFKQKVLLRKNQANFLFYHKILYEYAVKKFQ